MRLGDVDPVLLALRDVADRRSRREWACWQLSTSDVVLRGLLTGRPVPVELIAEPYRTALPLWGGFVDDAVALDVAIVFERARVAPTVDVVEGTTGPPTAGTRTVSLAQLGGLRVDERRPAVRRRGAGNVWTPRTDGDGATRG